MKMQAAEVLRKLKKKIENWPAQYLTHGHSRITKVVVAMKRC